MLWGVSLLFFGTDFTTVLLRHGGTEEARFGRANVNEDLPGKPKGDLLPGFDSTSLN